MKDAALPLPNHGHVILAKPSPILMYQIDTHDTRVLVDVPGKLPSVSNGDLQNYLIDVVSPEIPESIRVSTITYAVLVLMCLFRINSWRV